MVLQRYRELTFILPAIFDGNPLLLDWSVGKCHIVIQYTSLQANINLN